jgi:hypothetical protein
VSHDARASPEGGGRLKNIWVEVEGLRMHALASAVESLAPEPIVVLWRPPCGKQGQHLAMGV